VCCRLDGLDPMIAWAMGAATGHTAVALWRNEELFVCESNAKVRKKSLKKVWWPTFIFLSYDTLQEMAGFTSHNFCMMRQAFMSGAAVILYGSHDSQHIVVMRQGQAGF
jgi:hypothetical protein